MQNKTVKTIYKIPDKASLVIDEFLNLPLGGKYVVTPYFRNYRKQRAGLRVLIGKGDPGEIVREIKVAAKLKGVDLYLMTKEQIREFMIKNGIGIECSGYVVHVLNYWLKSQGSKSLINYLQFPNNSFYSKIKRKLRPVENIGANILTGDLNCKKVRDLNDLRPGDFVRSKGYQRYAHHLLLIIKVEMDNFQVKSFEYTHSSPNYGDENGVRFGKVEIINPKAELKDQNWTEIKHGRNYTFEELMIDYKDNGVRRLKSVDLKSEIQTIN